MSTLQKLKFLIGRPILGIASSVALMIAFRIVAIYLVIPIVKWKDNFLEPFLYTNTQWLGLLQIPVFVILFFAFVYVGVGVFIEVFKESGKHILQFSFGYLGASFVDSVFLLGRKAVYLILIPIILLICLVNSIIDYHILLSTSHSGILSNLPMLLNCADENVAESASFINWIDQDNVSIHNFFSFWFYSLRASIGGFRFEGRWQVIGFFLNSISYVALFLAGHFISRIYLESSISKTLDAFKLKSHKSLDGTFMTMIFASLFMATLLTFCLWWIFVGSEINLTVSPSIP